MSELTEEERKELLSGHIPKERFDEATNKLKDENTRLSNDLTRLGEQVKSLQTTSKPKDETPAIYTRAQLREYVENEQITQEQADTIWDRQVEISTDQKISVAVSAVSVDTNEKLSVQSLAGSIDEYIKILPDLGEDNSDNRKKVSKEYNSLSRIIGLPKAGTDKDLKLQVAALERAFGPVEKLREKLKSESDNRETMESLGGGEREESSEAPKKGALKNLSVEKKSYYQKGIDNGRYKDWDAVKEELEFTRKTT